MSSLWEVKIYTSTVRGHLQKHPVVFHPSQASGSKSNMIKTVEEVQ